MGYIKKCYGEWTDERRKLHKELMNKIADNRKSKFTKYEHETKHLAKKYFKTLSNMLEYQYVIMSKNNREGRGLVTIRETNKRIDCLEKLIGMGCK